MSNRIKTGDASRAVAEAQRRLEDLADGRARIKRSEINDPVLQDVAADNSVTSGCSAQSMRDVSVKKMKKALEIIGSSIDRVDMNQDGEIGYSEARRLSPLAARMLDHIADGSLFAGPAGPNQDALSLDDSSVRAAWEQLPNTGRIGKRQVTALLSAAKGDGNGISDTERSDLEKILDFAGDRMTDAARHHLEGELASLPRASSACGGSAPPPPASTGC